MSIIAAFASVLMGAGLMPTDSPTRAIPAEVRRALHERADRLSDLRFTLKRTTGVAGRPGEALAALELEQLPAGVFYETRYSVVEWSGGRFAESRWTYDGDTGARRRGYHQFNYDGNRLYSASRIDEAERDEPVVRDAAVDSGVYESLVVSDPGILVGDGRGTENHCGSLDETARLLGLDVPVTASELHAREPWLPLPAALAREGEVLEVGGCAGDDGSERLRIVFRRPNPEHARAWALDLVRVEADLRSTKNSDAYVRQTVDLLRRYREEPATELVTVELDPRRGFGTTRVLREDPEGRAKREWQMGEWAQTGGVWLPRLAVQNVYKSVESWSEGSPLYQYVYQLDGVEVGEASDRAYGIALTSAGALVHDPDRGQYQVPAGAAGLDAAVAGLQRSGLVEAPPAGGARAPAVGMEVGKHESDAARPAWGLAAIFLVSLAVGGGVLSRWWRR